jgi:hypothetical protein
MTQPVYLRLSHKAFDAGDPSVPGFTPPNLSLDADLNGSRLSDRQNLLAQLDRYRCDLDLDGGLAATNQFQRQAFDLLTSRAVADAFDLETEPPTLRDRYGRHLWGQSCLLARRLAEAGTSVITVDALAPEMGTPLYFSWDDHANAQPGWDLAKGMMWRAPFIHGSGSFGAHRRRRRAGSGGGLRMGQVVGTTTSKAEYPVERPLSPKDLLATVYRHLGIDYRQGLSDFSGRPIAILSEGEPIRELV